MFLPSSPRRRRCFLTRGAGAPRRAFRPYLEALEDRHVPAAPTGGSISGTVFHDANGNGTLDTGEAGIMGVTVFADLNGNGTFDAGDAGTVTGSDGTYTLTFAADGIFTIGQVVPNGFVQTSTNPIAVTISGGTTVTGINFGDKALPGSPPPPPPTATRGSISGIVFNDFNGNGTFDAGEPGLKGVIVFVDFNNSGDFDAGDVGTVTGDDGTYTLTLAANGTFTIRQVVPSGFVQTSAAAVVFSGSTDVPGINFGDQAQAGGGGGETAGRASTVGVFDPTTGFWYLRNSTSAGAPDAAQFAFGAPGWLPVTGDWNGDGRDTIGVVDGTGLSSPGVLVWYLRNSNSAGAADVAAPFAFGLQSWIPVVGDWDGNGTTTIGVYDPAAATWYLRNSNTPGPADLVFQYGGFGWTPVVGDWNGDGVDTVGVVDGTGKSSPFLVWYLRNSNSAGLPNITPFAYGVTGWKPVVGDWNGDGVETAGVVDGTGFSDPSFLVWFLRNRNNAGSPDISSFTYGLGIWTPVSGDWNFRGPP